MTDKITLILILHNRHKNAERLLEYYKDYNFPIIIADSSYEQHTFPEVKNNWTHNYTPGLSFTQKIEINLQKITTPYVVLCADDDFILPNALNKCVSFLDKNPSYSTAQGLSIRFIKESVLTKKIVFELMYRFSKSIENENVLTRLQEIFSSYRSVLYAVFRTDVLQYAFNGAGEAIKNLFLNEYITAVIPITVGKYKELPILYQVREYALDSDDKTAPDLDTIAAKANQLEQYEFDSFINYTSDKIWHSANISKCNLKEIIDKFSQQLLANRWQKISLKKRIGFIVNLIPFLGNWLIQKNRKRETERDLKMVIKTKEDEQNIVRIKELLLRYK